MVDSAPELWLTSVGELIPSKVRPLNGSYISCSAGLLPNNQLASRDHGLRLHERNILYAPDYVLNAGGIIDIAYQQGAGDQQAMRAHIDGIANTLTEIFQRAGAENRSTHAVADELAESRFQQSASQVMPVTAARAVS